MGSMRARRGMWVTGIRMLMNEYTIIELCYGSTEDVLNPYGDFSKDVKTKEVKT